MGRKLLSALVVMLMLLSTVAIPSFAAEILPETVISTAAIAGVIAPVKGATPVSTITDSETLEYTGMVTWSNNPSTFAADTIYTATITITPKTGYTLTGVAENFFIVAGATTTNAADSGVITAVFQKTELDTLPNTEPIQVVTMSAISVVAPVKGAAPVNTIDETTEYTATIIWSGSPVTFEADTVYTATITITPKTGYTLTGVAENFFSVAGATTTNAADSGIITAVFPKTAGIPPQLVSATTSLDGGTVTMTFDKTMADPSSDVGSFTVKINGRYYNNLRSYSMNVSSAALNVDTTKIDLILTSPLQRGDIVTVDYTPGTVMAADAGILAAFTKQSVANVIPVTINTNLVGNWQIFDHVGNWGEAPYQSEIPPNADDPRGNNFNRHIIISGSTVYFYGNGMEPFKDFVYLPSSQDAAKSFTFNLDLGGIKYHSMEGGGFLFNTKIDAGKISGYCVLFINNEGYALNLYQLDGVDVNDFHDGIGNYYNLGAGGEGITRLGSYPLPNGNLHSINLESSSSTVNMWDGTTKLIDNFALPQVYSNGVGIIGSYQPHDCNELSYFVFSSLNIQGVADLSAVLSGNQANLTFTAPEGATSVSVEKSTDAGATWTPANTSLINDTSTTATVNGLVTNNTYYFRLNITGGKYNGYSRVATVEYKGEVVITPTPVPSSVTHTQYILTINKTGEGMVLPVIGDHAYDSGMLVMLTATPAEGYTFEGWTGTTGDTVYMDQKKTITAVFKPIVVEPTPEVEIPAPTTEEEIPTPTPTPDRDEEEEPLPDVPDTLPKTGGIPPLMIYGFGGLVTAAGVYLRRKK